MRIGIQTRVQSQDRVFSCFSVIAIDVATRKRDAQAQDDAACTRVRPHDPGEATKPGSKPRI
jgi:hypothetical protein